MLDPEYIRSILPERMTKLYAAVEDDMLRDIARRIKKMNYATPTAMWQLQKANEMSVLYKDLMQTLAKYSGKSVLEMRETLKAAGIKSAEWDKAIYQRALKEGLIGEDGTINKAMLSYLQGSEMTVVPELEEVLRAAEQTARNTLQLTNTRAIQGAQNTFSDIVDKNYMGLQTGTQTFDQAMRNSINQLAQAGVQVLNYESGRKVSMEAAVKANIRTAANQACAKLAEKHMDLIGCTFVETTSHVGARPDHAAWQGRVFWWKEKGGKPKGYDAPDFIGTTGYGTATGLCGVNCRHSFYPFFPGLSTPSFDSNPAKSLGKDNDEMYAEQQKQRKLERNVRAAKKKQVVAEEMGDTEALKAAKTETAKAQAEVRKYVDEHKYLERSYMNEGIGKKLPASPDSASQAAAKKAAAASTKAQQEAAQKAAQAASEAAAKKAAEEAAAAAKKASE